MSTAHTTVSDAARLLTLVRYLESHPDSTLEELASLFGVSTADVKADLGMLARTGATMFPDDLIGIIHDEQGVFVEANAQFEQTLRLSMPEAISLAMGISNLHYLPQQSDPAVAASVLEKLSAAAGRDLAMVVDQTASTEQFAAELAIVDEALRTNHRVEFEYASRENPQLRPKEVFPYRALLNHDNGYLIGVDASDMANSYRYYRFDRMENLRVSNARTTLLKPPPDDAEEPFAFKSASTRARLELAPEYRWLAAQQNFEVVHRYADGRVVVLAPVVTVAWLRDFLIEHAAGVQLLEPKELREEMLDRIRSASKAYALE
ncbi:MAG: WYL domain-containing protein [Corynebacterium sp.]|nr:WYL domain-containing protein [Corynebacterium sp.]